MGCDCFTGKRPFRRQSKKANSKVKMRPFVEYLGASPRLLMAPILICPQGLRRPFVSPSCRPCLPTLFDGRAYNVWMSSTENEAGVLKAERKKNVVVLAIGTNQAEYNYQSGTDDHCAQRTGASLQGTCSVARTTILTFPPVALEIAASTLCSS